MVKCLVLIKSPLQIVFHFEFQRGSNDNGPRLLQIRLPSLDYLRYNTVNCYGRLGATLIRLLINEFKSSGWILN